jgi:FkbM family methyltransferase
MMQAAEPGTRLEELLAEGESSAAQREREAFDRAAHPFAGRIVIYGAGALGQRTLNGLRANGLDALAFADRNPAAWSRNIGGLRVLSPEDAAREFGFDAAFVVAVWNPAASGGMSAIAAGLSALGCRRVVPFVWLYWKFPGTFLPHYLWDQPSRVLRSASDVRKAYAIFDGPRSQAEFVRQVELRLTGDTGRLRAPDGDRQYFPSRLFHPLEDECFIDCGAFNGDTLTDFADWTGGSFRCAWAFEADPANFEALERTVAADSRLRGRVRARRGAVGARCSKARFAASGLPGAAISESGDIEVDCVRLDDALAGEAPTFVKMDIEGAELDALQGASGILSARPPLLAICAYHAQDHLWRVPLLLRTLAPAAQFALRMHRVDGFDLVCYAVPPDRAANAPSEEAH